MVLTLDPDKRVEFDRLLDTASAVAVYAEREQGAPSWWFGDEEAYESSMRAAAMVGNEA